MHKDTNFFLSLYRQKTKKSDKEVKIGHIDSNI